MLTAACSSPGAVTLALTVQALDGVKQITESFMPLLPPQPLPNVVSMVSVKVVPLGKTGNEMLAPWEPVSTGWPLQSGLGVWARTGPASAANARRLKKTVRRMVSSLVP